MSMAKEWAILYNPLANNGQGESGARKVFAHLGGEENCEMVNLTEVSDLPDYLAKMESKPLICGGDGTIWFLANALPEGGIEREIWYAAAGTGNDFLNDIEKGKDEPVLLNPYLKRLPQVTVNGKTVRFLNDVGFGLDGYCCERGDELRNANPGQKINYTKIALEGLMGKFKPRKATVTVDGETRVYEKVWLAPAMNGRYYGGGMNMAPGQNRLDPEGKLTCVIAHGCGKLTTLLIFPSIFKGEHVKHKKYIDILTGHDITVEFDTPGPLQIDGETVSGVKSYHAWKK